jgi:hypothetical protein
MGAVTEDPSGPSRRTLAVGGLVLAVVAVGWFLLSMRVAHSDARTAAGEAVGAALGLLLFASVIGAIRGHRDTNKDADH